MEGMLELSHSFQKRIVRLVEFIRSQYGGEVKLVDTKNLYHYQPSQKVIKGLKYKDSSTRLFYLNGKLLFSLKDPPIGFIELTHNSPSTYNIEKIASLIDFVVSFRDSSEQAINCLMNIEEHMRRSGQIQKKAENMYFLFRSPFKESYPIESIDFKNQIPSSHIFVEGPSEWEIYKVAFNYHMDRGRPCFVCYFDLDEEHRSCLDSLNSLGNTTIYIPDLNKLSQLDVKILMQLLADPDCIPSVVGGRVKTSLTLTLYFPQSQFKKQLREMSSRAG